MTVISSYSTNRDPGSLRLKPLDVAVNLGPDSLAKEANEKGVYVHKIARNLDRPASDQTRIQEQVGKIIKNEIPVPATLVGVGFHKTYNNRVWTDSSGLVFAPDTASVLSYKGDIYTSRLSQAKKFTRDPGTSLDANYKLYAKYLNEEFNKYSSTKSLIHNRTPKAIKLRPDAEMAQEKYRELAVRANLCFQHPANADNRIQDVSSKFLIAKQLCKDKLPGDWKKSDLLRRLALFNDTKIGPLVAHARLKIEQFDGDTEVSAYLEKGLREPTKRNHYQNIAKEWGSLPCNEHLLMPSPENILGVLASIDSVRAVDHAMQISQEQLLEKKHSVVDQRAVSICDRWESEVG